jgi:hypothetical protein
MNWEILFVFQFGSLFVKSSVEKDIILGTRIFIVNGRRSLHIVNLYVFNDDTHKKICIACCLATWSQLYPTPLAPEPVPTSVTEAAFSKPNL